MGPGDFIDDFKRDAVGKIPKRSYPANDVSERLGVSTHSPYAWKRTFAKAENMMAKVEFRIGQTQPIAVMRAII